MAKIRCIQIFTKSPTVTDVKTRLSPCLTPTQRINFYTSLVRYTLSTASKTQANALELWCQPSCDQPFIQSLFNKGLLQLHSQHGKDLGERMITALNSATVKKNVPLLIGCDCPFITPSYLNEAFSRLKTKKKTVVFGPAIDGGFVLMGSNVTIPEKTFKNISWSTPQVLQACTQALRSLGFHCINLASLPDIDHCEDLDLLKGSSLYPL